MNLKAEKIIWIYIGIYASIILFRGFIEYVVICSGKSLDCAIDINKLILTIITISVFLLPISIYLNRRKLLNFHYKKNLPLIGIIGYISLVLVGTWLFNYFWFGNSNQNFSLKSLEENKRLTYITSYISFLTYTATLLAPLVVYQMYVNWKDQETYKKSIQIINETHDKIQNLLHKWLEFRDENDFSYSLNLLATIPSTDLKNPELYSHEYQKIQKLYENLNEIIFLTNKLYFNQKVDIEELTRSFDNIRNEINEYREALTDFRLNCRNKNLNRNFTYSEIELRITANRLSRYCNNLLPKKHEIQYIDYDQIIFNLIQETLKKFRNLKDKL